MSTRFGANDFYIKMRKRMRLHKILMVVFFVVILGLGVISSIVFSFNDTEYTITVTDKERNSVSNYRNLICITFF